MRRVPENRLRMVDYLEPLVHHLKVPTLRKRIGINILKVTVNHFSNHEWGMPATRMNEVTCTTALLVYVLLFELFD